MRLERKTSPFIAWSVEREASLLDMPSCIRPEVRLTLDQCILCSDCCEKCIMASSGNLVLFCTALKQDTSGAYEQSYTFAQPAVQAARWS